MKDIDSYYVLVNYEIKRIQNVLILLCIINIPLKEVNGVQIIGLQQHIGFGLHLTTEASTGTFTE